MHSGILVSCREVFMEYTRASIPQSLVVKVVVVDKVTTTMELAPTLFHGTPLAVYALEQTRGRGRTGPWKSPRGGLWLTLVVRSTYHFSEPQTMQVALAFTIAHSIGVRYGLPVRVVWPNDLVVGGRKLGGVLVEKYADKLAVGVGINVNNDPPIPGSTSLIEHVGTRLDIHELVHDIVRTLVLGLSLTSIPQSLLEAYDATRHQRVLVQTPTSIVEGVSQGVSGDGTLAISTSSGTLHVDCCSLLGMEKLEYKPLP